ncbi:MULTISPECIES: hypothetical protein [unclassified Microbacterium]
MATANLPTPVPVTSSEAKETLVVLPTSSSDAPSCCGGSCSIV